MTEIIERTATRERLPLKLVHGGRPGIEKTKVTAITGKLAMPEATISLETRVVINTIADIVEARMTGRLLADKMGFTNNQSTLIVTVISELARNIILYAKSGEIVLSSFKKRNHNGLLVCALDQGPGIENVDRVLASGFSTSGGLGLGLSGVRQIMDEFEIKSEKGVGTRVNVTIWLR